MNSVERIRATYGFRPLDRLFRKEFGIWPSTRERWLREGWSGDVEVFGYDPLPFIRAINLGWTESPFIPPYEEKILQVEADYEILQDSSGRVLKVFKNKRHGVMPQYIRSTVSSREDWERDVKPRLDPYTPERWQGVDERLREAAEKVGKGEALYDARVIGGYMHLRNLFGPEQLLYVFYDDPDLVHEIMRNWLELMVTVLTKIQDRVPFFRVFLAEDISFKTGPLISPAMIREFLLPYYKELIQTLRVRQKEHIYFEVDTDGNVEPIIPLYMEAGVDAMSPFEVAAGNDVVEIGKRYPSLVIVGGIDKRILARGKDAIDKELERIIPVMFQRGGYIPSCDHSVPDDVPFGNYLYYRERIMQLDH